MDAAEKVLERMRRTRAGHRPRDFDTLFYGFGFQARDKGGHRLFVHHKFKQLRMTVPQHDPVKGPYSAQAVDLIDRLRELGETDESKGAGSKS